MSEQKQIIIKTYRGRKTEAIELFQRDSEKMAEKGYIPKSQDWVDGDWGCAAFVVAFLLLFLLIGVFLILYFIFVKPEGLLTVTYELKQIEQPKIKIEDSKKTCPMCAEKVQKAAKICRYCRHEFDVDKG